MKNRIIAVVIVFCLVVCFSFIGKFNSYADPVTLTASQVGAAALSVGSSLGIDWQVTGVGNGFVGNWIGTEVERYDNGESLIEAVSESIYMDAAGKLVITQIGYNKICEFVEWLQEKYDINNKILGTNNMVFDPQNIAGSLNGWAPYPGGSLNANNYFREGWSQMERFPVMRLFQRHNTIIPVCVFHIYLGRLMPIMIMPQKLEALLEQQLNK